MTRRVSELTAWAWLVGFCLITASCSGSGDAPPPTETTPRAASPAALSTVQTLVIEFQSQPDPPKAGDNAFEVVVKQPDGTPVTDATVTSVFSMPAMPAMNMPAMRSTATLAHAGSGRYRGTGQLSMGGTWNVTVTVAHGVEELGRKHFSIVAK